MATIESPPKSQLPHNPAQPRGTRWLLAALFLLAILGFYVSGLHRTLSFDAIRANLGDWQHIAQQHLLPALLAYFLVYVVVTALSLPAAVLLTLVGGAIFGRWLGTAVVSLASTLGATLAFLASRYLFRDTIQRRFSQRLESINQGIERDGAFYLFTLRLVPAVPFFLINVGMGLTPIRVSTYALVSWVGMLPGTFLYVNAGTALATLDSPADLVSFKILAPLALLGIFPLVIRKLIQWRIRRRTLALSLVGLLLLVAAGLGVRTVLRYRTADEMELPLREYSNAEYPEDPAMRSGHHGQYNGRRLTLVKKDSTHFDFVFEPLHPHIARIVFRDVDVSLMTPSLPPWTKDDDGLRRIALTDRQWNRQEVRFGQAGSKHVEISGGDGFEAANLCSAELAKNCLNAGLWEVLLFTKEHEEKTLYYQGWFTFPLGHYKALFEQNTGLSYAKHWYYLEHWFDPAGTPVALEKLREVVHEGEVPATFDRSERVIALGEQARKRRTTMAENIVAWEDFYDGRKVRFASFIPPGRYSVNHPWKNEYRRIDRFDKAILRAVRSPASTKSLHELELVFSGTKTEGVCRFVVSGLDLDALPRLSVNDYSHSPLYMPMGIGVPPFYQTYEDLQRSPPERSPYFSVLLDENDRWIDHHSFGIDGPVIHRDAKDPELLHVYLLSYERHSLIAHVIVRARLD